MGESKNITLAPLASQLCDSQVFLIVTMTMNSHSRKMQSFFVIVAGKNP